MPGYDEQHLVDALVVTMVDNSPYEGLAGNPMPGDMYDNMVDAMERLAAPIHEHAVSWWNEEGGGIFPDEKVKMTLGDPVSGFLSDKIDDDTITYDEITLQLKIGNIPAATDSIVGGVIVGATEASGLFMTGNEIYARIQTDVALSDSNNEMPSSRAVKSYVDNAIFDISGGGGDPFPYIIDDASTNTSIEIAEFSRTTSGTAANNIGGYLTLSVENSIGIQRALEIEHKLITATSGSEESRFVVKGQLSGVTSNLLLINSTGETLVGPKATGGGIGVIGIGYEAIASSDYTIAIGYQAESANSYNISIGSGAGNSSGTIWADTLSLGHNANNGSNDIGAYSVALGSGPEASGSHSMAFGRDTQATALGSITIGANTQVTAQGAILIGYHTSTQTNSLTDSFKLMWDGIVGFHVGLTLGTQVTVNSDPDTNLTDVVNGVIAYDNTDHEFRSYINGGWTNLVSESVSKVMKVVKAEILYTNTTQTTIIILPDGAVIWDIGIDIVIDFDASGGNFIYIGITGSSSRYVTLSNTETQVIQFISSTNGGITPNNMPEAMSGSTNITFLYDGPVVDASQGQAFVYIHYSL